MTLAVVVDADACVPVALIRSLSLTQVPEDPPLLLEPAPVPVLALESSLAESEVVAESCATVAASGRDILYVAVGDGYGSNEETIAVTHNVVLTRAPDVDLTVHRSEAALMGCGWQAVAAARAAETGGADGAQRAAAEVARRVTVLAMLEHPEMAGLGSGSTGARRQRVVATLRGPTIDVLDRPTLRADALAQLRDRFTESATAVPDGAPLHVAVHHAGAQAGAEAIETHVRRRFPAAEVVVAPLTRHAASRLGPRMIGIAWYCGDS